MDPEVHRSTGPLFRLYKHSATTSEAFSTNPWNVPVGRIVAPAIRHSRECGLGWLPNRRSKLHAHNHEANSLCDTLRGWSASCLQPAQLSASTGATSPSAIEMDELLSVTGCFSASLAAIGAKQKTMQWRLMLIWVAYAL